MNLKEMQDLAGITGRQFVTNYELLRKQSDRAILDVKGATERVRLARWALEDAERSPMTAMSHDDVVEERANRAAQLQALKADVARAEAAARGAMEKAVAECERIGQSMMSQCSKVLKKPPEDPQKALLREIREQRTWARLSQRLDRISNNEAMRREVDQAWAEAVQREDEAMTGVIKTEVGPYLHGRDMADIALTIEHNVRELERTSGRPEQVIARYLQEDIGKGMGRVQVTLRMLDHEIETGNVAPNPLPSFREHATVELAQRERPREEEGPPFDPKLRIFDEPRTFPLEPPVDEMKVDEMEGKTGPYLMEWRGAPPETPAAPQTPPPSE